jgi:hypothetical protein
LKLSGDQLASLLFDESRSAESEVAEASKMRDKSVKKAS